MTGAPTRICFIGDSLTLGVGDPLVLGWPGRVTSHARNHGADVTAYNLGVRRETSVDIAARWKQEAQPRLPDPHPRLIMFAFGTNDCLDDNGARRVPLDLTLEITAAVLREAKELAPVLMVGPPPTADMRECDRIAQLSHSFENLCEREEVEYLGIFEDLVADPQWGAELARADSYHPGAAGYDRIAGLISSWPAWRRSIGLPLGAASSQHSEHGLNPSGC